MATAAPFAVKSMLTLPTDGIRQLQWRFADRFDLQLLVQSARGVARSTVARMVAAGERNTHEWTQLKEEMLEAFDRAGMSAIFMEPEEGGFIAGPKNLALALAAFELAWVDGGAATASLAGFLALAPIHERGTPEQVQHYMSLAVPSQADPDELHPARKPLRGAFCLTEPIPYVGVDTGMLGGKVRISHWHDGEEPWLEVDKRGRFITNIATANFVTAAVNSDDPRIKGSCVVILEETDLGIFDRGTPTKKLVHQLSSTGDPVFHLKVPASRIVGGYTVKDGFIVPNFTHSEIIEAVFRRTRVTVGLMTAAKLLSAVEPVIRYQRSRFRGAEGARLGSIRYEQGIQQREDALHRLVDVWACGEAASSLGFAAARLFDDLDPLERQKNALLAERGIAAGRAQVKALRESEGRAVELLGIRRNDPRHAELAADPLVQFVLKDAEANVLCPATKLWNTGHGANMMREAVSLMGGYGITEDCPGFLASKWMDAQLEATYEGPEAVQRRQLTVTMTSDVFLALFRKWTSDMRRIASTRPGTGACTLASAMQMWQWTLTHLQRSTDPDGGKLYHGQRQGVTFAMADALCWLLASRCQILDVLELEARGAGDTALTELLPGAVQFLSDLCHVQTAAASGEVSRICAELVFGYKRHPSWNDAGCSECFSTDEIQEFEETMPGITAMVLDVLRADGGHPDKAGPCATCARESDFLNLQSKLSRCLSGSRLAKDRAAETVSTVMIPEALDYPQ
ncbi:MAG TPA: acyl-CoA dehydrogenase family protein [Terracidiphilus sp.]|jgi:alkylation response protein AidB-like acyl-CoA dehydrogenase|nr:acyl-CoA dehydrogenase family protein [Terracidiphilus sp.]